MNLAPCAAVLWTVLLAFAFAFTQELDARAVHQQMQRLSAGTVAQLHLQALLAATDGAEIWHRSVQLGQLQQTLHHAKRLAQRLIKKAFDTQAKLDRCIREQPAAPTLAAGLSQPAHSPVQPQRQGAACFESRVVLRPVRRAVACPHLLAFTHPSSLPAAAGGFMQQSRLTDQAQ